LIEHYGDPFADSSAVPSFQVAELAARDVTVALNGDGGDESFAGYNRYVSGALAERLAWLPGPVRRAAAAVGARLPTGDPSGTAARAGRLLASLGRSTSHRYGPRMLYLSAGERNDLYEPEFARAVDTGYAEDLLAGTWESSSARSPVDRMLDVDVSIYLPGDLLVKMDIATMASSLEARSPFLDHELMEMAARLPASAKIAGTRTKAALKDALAT